MKYLLIVVSLLAVLAVACSGDDDDGDDATTTPASATEAPTEASEDPTEAPSEAPTEAATEAPDSPSPTSEPDETATPADSFEGTTDPVSIDGLVPGGVGAMTLTEVRTGSHPESGGFDRMVFEFEDIEGSPDAHPGISVEYVEQAVACGSGVAVEVAGDAMLLVRLDMAQAHDEQGNLTIEEQYAEGPGDSIIEALQSCDFEGVVQWALGVAGTLPYNVTVLEGPTRVVVDVAWP